MAKTRSHFPCILLSIHSSTGHPMSKASSDPSAYSLQHIPSGLKDPAGAQTERQLRPHAGHPSQRNAGGQGLRWRRVCGRETGSWADSGCYCSYSVQPGNAQCTRCGSVPLLPPSPASLSFGCYISVLFICRCINLGFTGGKTADHTGFSVRAI